MFNSNVSMSLLIDGGSLFCFAYFVIYLHIQVYISMNRVI